MEPSEETKGCSRAGAFLIILFVLLAVYVSGYAWVRHSYDASRRVSYGTVCNPPSDMTVFSDSDRLDRVLYCLYWPFLVLDKQLTGRYFGISDLTDLELRK